MTESPVTDAALARHSTMDKPGASPRPMLRIQAAERLRNQSPSGFVSSPSRVFTSWNSMQRIGPCVLHDDRYTREFPDMAFVAAALVLTRVVSRPSRDLVTFDLGHKACAADPPAGDRLFFPAIPDAKEVLQNEEHLVIETERASSYRPGDVELAIPTHICPTSALHSHAWVVSGGRARERWEVTARDRALTL